MTQTTTPSLQPLPSEQGQSMSIEQAISTAYAHWNVGQTNQAEVLCQKVLAAWPEQPDVLHLLGLMSHNCNNLDLAIDYLRRACLSPQAPALYLSNLAEMCRQKGLLEEGEKAARRAVTLDMVSTGAWNNLGIILQEMGRYEEALMCLERVVNLKPNYAEAHNNLGNTFRQMGRLDKALDCYRRAIALNPDYPEAHSNLSNLYKDLGNRQQAVEEANRAIEINPSFFDAYINAAAAESTWGHYEAALQWLNALLGVAPNYAAALANKALTLIKLRHPEEALQTARQAVFMAPENGDALGALAQALQACGDYEEALSTYDKAAGAKGATAFNTLNNKGTLLMEIGRKDEAIGVFREILALNPQSATALFHLADTKTFQANDPDIARMETLLEKGHIQHYSDRMSLHFALGKAWLDVGNPERAFHYLDAGNRLKRAQIDYDPEATHQWIKSIADTFSETHFQKNRGGGVSSDRPVFIIGMPRSGTTLVEQIIASHPDTWGAGELTALSDSLGTSAFPQSFAQATPEDYTRIGNAYTALIDRMGKPHQRVVDKMPANFLYAGVIALALPQARLIHCRRNPVDTCLSCYTKLFTAEQQFTYDQKELGQFYKTYEKLMAHWRDVLPADRFLEVDYEDIVANQETESKRLIDFCGLPWNDRCLEFHKLARPVKTASANQVRQPVYQRSVGRWKACAPYLKDLLQALGTTPDES